MEMATKKRILTLAMDMITEILLHLPTKSIIRFKSLNKSLCTLITSPHFIKNHLTTASTKPKILLHQYLLPERRQYRCFVSIISEVDSHFQLADPTKLLSLRKAIPRRFQTKVAGSCHGLVLLEHNEHDIALWNPFIKRYKKLPFFPIQRKIKQFCHLGFGYDCVSDDYKAVRIVYMKSGSVVNNVSIQVWIFSLRLNSWRRVENLPWEEYSYVMENKSGVFLNGKLYWLCSEKADWRVKKIAVFDLGKEMFCRMPLRPSINNLPQLLSVFNGCLCVNTTRYGSSGSHSNLELYAVKEEDDDGGGISSNLLYSIQEGAIDGLKFSLWKHVAFSKKGDKVLLEDNGRDIFWYDLVSERGERLDIDGGDGSQKAYYEYYFDSVVCYESLVSPGYDSEFDGAMVA